MMARFNKKR